MTTPAVHVIVFSKDRPLQLHGYLTSLFEQWHGDFRVSTLVRLNAPYGEAYGQVRQEFGGHPAYLDRWHERDFAQDLTDLLGSCDAPLTCFGCDDAVFTAPVETGALLGYFRGYPPLLGISLRLGQTVKRGMWGQEQVQPHFLNGWMDERAHAATPYLEWDCTAPGSVGDWAYPWDTVGTVYRTDFVRRVVAALVENGLATNPSTLEDYGSRWWRHHADGGTLLRAWHRPRLVLPTVNVVQTVFPNGTVGESRLTPEFLLECWNAGLRLDTWRYAMGAQPDTWRTGEFYLRRAA